MVGLTRELVAASSQNPGEDERAVAEVITTACAQLGLPSPARIGVSSRPNLLTRLEFGPGGQHLLLCGHSDTKPIGEGKWATDPLALTELDGELRGRGAVDMKGAIAAMLLAAASLAANPPVRGALTLAFLADEENGARFGGRWLAENEPLQADAAVIGEPGGLVHPWDHLHLGSRGICNFDLEVATAQGHTGLRDALGTVSATEVLARLIVALRDEFAPTTPSRSWGQPSVSPGVLIEGGVNYGVLPGAASARNECRLVPGMDEERFRKELETFVAARTPEGARVTVSVRDWIDAAGVDPQEPIAIAARRTLEETLGQVPPDYIFPATTDGTWLARMGIPTLPALGPGLLRHAHAVDERVTRKELVQAQTLYERLVRRFCERQP